MHEEVHTGLNTTQDERMESPVSFEQPIETKMPKEENDEVCLSQISEWLRGGLILSLEILAGYSCASLSPGTYTSISVILCLSR